VPSSREIFEMLRTYSAVQCLGEDRLLNTPPYISPSVFNNISGRFISENLYATYCSTTHTRVRASVYNTAASSPCFHNKETRVADDYIILYIYVGVCVCVCVCRYRRADGVVKSDRKAA